ncbi:MAG: ribonuclease PH, partial [Myxococcales bacterium]|nr:ribonuclease PH [Myxococcales bacterium]
VATGRGRFVEVQGTGEEGTFSPEDLTELTTLALRGVSQLTEVQQKMLGALERS